jgi:transcriptional regulator with XRE-family HTH domain
VVRLTAHRCAAMDDVQLGSALRAIRLRRGARQKDIAAAAGVSQQTVSLLECGHLGRVGIGTARRVAAVLEVRLDVVPRWRGGELPRLLDEHHAAMVERAAARLRATGWEVTAEYTFNHFGERGSVDLIGWKPAHGALVLVEVKSRLIDLQDLFASLDRKARVVPLALRGERDWHVRTLATILVVTDTTAARSVVARHRATFAAALPGRARDVWRWLRDPQDELAAVWFLSVTTGRGAKRITPAARRVRCVRAASSDPATTVISAAHQPPWCSRASSAVESG